MFPDAAQDATTSAKDTTATTPAVTNSVTHSAITVNTLLRFDPTAATASTAMPSPLPRVAHYGHHDRSVPM